MEVGGREVLGDERRNTRERSARVKARRQIDEAQTHPDLPRVRSGLGRCADVGVSDPEFGRVRLDVSEVEGAVGDGRGGGGDTDTCKARRGDESATFKVLSEQRSSSIRDGEGWERLTSRNRQHRARPSSSRTPRRVPEIRYDQTTVRGRTEHESLLPVEVIVSLAIGLRVAEVGDPTDGSRVVVDVLGRKSW